MKQKKNLDKWIFEIPASDVMDEDVNSKQGKNPCFFCGKHINNEKYFVHYLNTGNIISTTEDMENSQGFFAIGSECKNRIPDNFVFIHETKDEEAGWPDWDTKISPSRI